MQDHLLIVARVWNLHVNEHVPKKRVASQRALCSLYSVKTLFNLLKWDLNGIYSSGNLSSALGDNNEPAEDV